MLFHRPLPLLVCATLAFSQSNTLPARETLYYNIDWRLFTAGKARVELTTTGPPRPGLQTNLHLESIGIVSKLFKVVDDYSMSWEGTSYETGTNRFKVGFNSDGTIVSIKIDPKVVDPKDVEMLEDLILGAVTNALASAKKMQDEELGKVTAGMNLPGMM